MDCLESHVLQSIHWTGVGSNAVDVFLLLSEITQICSSTDLPLVRNSSVVLSVIKFKILKAGSQLKSRLELSRTIAGTHRLHCFIPLSSELSSKRDFSDKPVMRQECTMLSTRSAISFAAINGYVTAMYDGF